MLIAVLWIISVVAVGNSAGKEEASSYFKLCSRSDPDVDQCIKNSIMPPDASWVAGIPDINLPSADPLKLAKLDMKEGSGNFNFYVLLTNAVFTGLKDATVDDLRTDFSNPRNVTIHLKLKMPHFRLKARYDMAGRVLVLPLFGKGSMELNMTGVTTTLDLKGHLKPSPMDGQEYLSIDKCDFDILTKGGTCYLSNLFNNDKALGASANRFLNENFQQLFLALKHLPGKALGTVAKDYAKKIFDSYPLDELVLP